MMIPTIHLNGTGADALVDQLADATTALLDAERVLHAAAPNARDYYPQGPDAFRLATQEHVSRLERLRSVRLELVTICEAIADGRPA